jgi:outer membrane receptor protein involved in Fe transport
MESDQDGSDQASLQREVRCWCLILVLVLGFGAVHAIAAGPRRNFQIEAGDASVMLNEFSRQSDLQVLFDFNVLMGMQTRAVRGNLQASDALTAMLAGTGLVFEFVNDHTLAVTHEVKKPPLVHRQERDLPRAPKAAPPAATPSRELEQVLISGSLDSGTTPLLGAQAIQLSRLDIDRSGQTTTEDLLRTLPQVFGGGPSEDTVLGREATTNSAKGTGINLRGLNAGATVVLIDGKRMAPSGTDGAFNDISNIPLSIVDHVDVLPDGASARYGGDAVGGVVNFVTRTNYSGAQSQLRGGTVTSGSMGQRQLSQLLGKAWDSGSAFLSFEYYEQDALQARYRAQETGNLTAFGGSDFETPYGSPGTIIAGGKLYPIPRGQDGTALTAASLKAGAPNLYDQDQGTYITPRENRWSVFGKANDRLNEDLSWFGEGLFTRRDIETVNTAGLPLSLVVTRANPFYVNPTGGTDPIPVLYGTAADFGPPVADNRIDTGNFSLGLDLDLHHSWDATGYLGYTFEKQHQRQYGHVSQAALNAALADPNPATAFNPFGDGSHTDAATLTAISSVALYDLDSSLKTVGVTAAGPVFPLPGGNVQATVGADYRLQSFNDLLSDATPQGGATRDSYDRRVAATFGEFRIPFVGADNALPFVRRLELSLGARYEHYSDVGGVGVPKVGMFWAVSPSLSFRGTWAKSFSPPNLPDLSLKDSLSQLVRLPDPQSSSGVSTVLARFGTNPYLQPERARTWTLGADFSPPFVPGLSLSLTYFDIRYTGRIDRAQIQPDVLQNPNFAWIVNRNFTAAERNAACTQSIFTGAAGTCLTTPISAILDDRLLNVALLATRGFDASGRYSTDTPVGRIELGLTGTYLLNYSQADTPTSPLLDIVSTQNNPIDLRLRASAVWTRGGFAATSFVNYDNSYRDTLSVPNRKIDSWTTVDLQLSYETGGAAAGWLSHVQFALSTQNIFNSYPPFVNNPVGVGYDQENADLVGRVVSFDVRKRW